MDWKKSFDTQRTNGEEFTLDNNDKIIATTMHLKTSDDSISYYKDNKLTALCMDLKDYNGTSLEFVAIMPDQNLKEYVQELKLEDLNSVTKQLKPASNTKDGVEISIPKFSFEYDLDLKNDLENLGIKDAFSMEKADFSNMTSNAKGLYVSHALHKANIDFSENGIKAAAATVFVMMEKSMAIEKTNPEQIKIDKPFMYFIKDKNTDEIWFVGTMYEPNEWQKEKMDYNPM